MPSLNPPDGRDGTLDIRETDCVVRFERDLTHPVERVWAAITEPDQLAGWWGRVDVVLRPGGRFVVEWRNTDDEGNRATMHATITALEPPHLLELSGDRHGVLRFELRPQRAGSHLSFTSTVALPDEFRTKVLAGWHYHLDSLARTLDGQATDLVGLPGWEELHDRYVGQLTP